VIGNKLKEVKYLILRKILKINHKIFKISFIVMNKVLKILINNFFNKIKNKGQKEKLNKK